MWVMASFTNYNACEYASTGIDFVKTQTQTALEANDLAMVKFFTYKALNTIDKTKTNFIDCGCEEASGPIDMVEKNLKLVALANNLDETKKFLNVALQSTILSMQLLREHEEKNSSFYGDDVLVMNTKSSFQETGRIEKPRGQAIEDQVNKSLKDFKTSLDNVVAHVECADAFTFISKLHKKAKEDLKNPGLSESEKVYHQKVKEIAYTALLSLEGCPVD